MRVHAIVTLAAAMGLAASASAAPVKPWIGFHGSWSTYTMGDANDWVGVVNAGLAAGGTTLRLDEIKNGFGFGAAIGVDVPLATVGVGYERLTASTDLAALGGNLNFSFPANAFRGFVQYKLPVSGPVGLHLGVAGGVISEAGTWEVGAIDSTESIKLTGSGPLFEGYFGSTFWAIPRVGIMGAVGYRYAKISGVKGEAFGVKVTMPSTSNGDMSLDYSGVFVRLGFKAALTD